VPKLSRVYLIFYLEKDILPGYNKNMNKFISLYDFIDFAKANRKYPASTANNLKSALKIFEKELNAEELKSIDMVKDSVEEIFRSVVIANKTKSIISLNTYKARLLKVITDYKKYGVDPSKIQNWKAKTRKSPPLLINKDKTDKIKIKLSSPVHTPVYNLHKLELALRPDANFTLLVPRDISTEEAKKIKEILDSLITE